MTNIKANEEKNEQEITTTEQFFLTLNESNKEKEIIESLYNPKLKTQLEIAEKLINYKKDNIKDND